MRVFAIGDIHGHLTALDTLLATIPAQKDDLLVFLGDYVDKGPDVPGVLDRLIALNTERQAIFLRGNHDQLMLDAKKDPALHLPGWECLSGGDPLASYGKGTTRKLLKSVPPAPFDFLQNTCRNFHETERFLFVHAGLNPDRAPAEES
ncbi:MAG: metallophosphoesterase family protein, partial [Verrucomicrobia bacterium]|nr:metallophosphoesterase family protein [Verrucomicrobiota bacterium]